MEKPLILITNDDGITAPGIRNLIEFMEEIGEVWVVAPDKPQSGMGHAVTINATLQCEKLELDGSGRNEFSCSGTPVDCVKMAMKKILPRTPDLCVSGINHGSNASINVIYSGTMSAAVEAGICQIPAIGFSLCDFSFSADFKAAKEHIQKIAKNVLEHGLTPGTVLNVNIPKLEKEQIKGIKVCRQADAFWDEDFVERTNPHGKTYYWLAGKFVNRDHGEDTDVWALENGYVSVVPVQYDLTAYPALSQLNNWEM